MSSPLITLGKARKPRISVEQQSYSGRQKRSHETPLAAHCEDGGRSSPALDATRETAIHLAGQLSRPPIRPTNQLPALESPGRRAAPFKPMAHYTEEELALLGGLSSNTTAPINKVNYSLVEKVVQGSAPSDFDLLNSTMKRLGDLERKVWAQEQELQLKDQEIRGLEKKIVRLQQLHSGNATSGKREQELEQQCNKLKKQIREMESFLGDYGLVWVGENNADVSPASTARTQSPVPTSLTSFQPDFDRVLENLRDLNVLGGEGESHIKYQKGGARFKAPESVPLTLYKNGIILFQGPFRSYQEKSTQLCMRDIMDGYFPSELQNRFPDGVTFQVTDNRNVVFQEQSRWDDFPGSGQTVGSSGNNIQTSKKPGLQLSTDQFLNRLPKSVVRGGRIVDIRGAVKDTLQGSEENEMPKEILVESPQLSKEQSTQKNIAVSTLRIRSVSGEKTYKVRMLSSETLADLRNYLSICRAPDLSSYNIISPFPYCVYEDDTSTLEEIGLVPNAFLVLRARSGEGAQKQSQK
ncbi:UBX domain-containing protein 11 isoform X2 [Xenopus laevis]|uniref:UBX domain-containing protein 11 n=1 Tax=Xenopus laevis TaxID=8355 RepID=A0A8J1MFJ7_XENLA|nr:UBX domain-containing protein 11 isoform X2 [Xenopus laevis]